MNINIKESNIFKDNDLVYVQYYFDNMNVCLQNYIGYVIDNKVQYNFVQNYHGWKPINLQSNDINQMISVGVKIKLIKSLDVII